MTRTRGALAGVAAALAWAALEPLDRRLFDHDYSDVAMLGKFVTRGKLWPVAGLAIHAANGATFGVAVAEAARFTKLDVRKLAVGLALAENTVLFPLGFVIDRVHPARGTRGLAPLWSTRGAAQATARHAVFGVVLGALAGEQ